MQASGRDTVTVAAASGLIKTEIWLRGVQEYMKQNVARTIVVSTLFPHVGLSVITIARAALVPVRAVPLWTPFPAPTV